MRNIKNWQIQIGFWGGITWMSLMFNLDQAIEFDATIVKAINGYIIGFITAFSGYMFWQIMHGRYERIFGDEKGVFRIVSYFLFFLMMSFGLFGVVNGIINSNPWQYNATFILGGIVVNQGVVPIINYVDRSC